MLFCIWSDFGVTGADVRVGSCKYLLNQQTLISNIFKLVYTKTTRSLSLISGIYKNIFTLLWFMRQIVNRLSDKTLEKTEYKKNE